MKFKKKIHLAQERWKKKESQIKSNEKIKKVLAFIK